LNPYFGHAVKIIRCWRSKKFGTRRAGAAVVAIDERTAFEALEFIDVKYEELKVSSPRKKRWPGRAAFA